MTCNRYIIKKKLAFTPIRFFTFFIIGGFSLFVLFAINTDSDSLEASKIANSLRSLKSVAVSYYLDNPDGPIPRIDPDLKSRMETPPDPRYGIDDFSSDTVYAYFDLSGMSSGIVEKLKNNDMAVEVVSDDTIARIRIR